MRGSLLAAFLTVLALASGCGGQADMYDISGKVTLDGKDVADGDITFLSDDKQFGSDGAKIKDGAYTAKVHKGKKKVEIHAVREVPGKKGPMGEPAMEEYIPEKYNTNTTLEIEVGPGKTTHDFAMTSKK
jgi:hypothetical protein